MEKDFCFHLIEHWVTWQPQLQGSLGNGDLSVGAAHLLTNSALLLRRGRGRKSHLKPLSDPYLESQGLACPWNSTRVHNSRRN